MSTNTNPEMRPPKEVVARLEELEAMIRMKDQNMTEALYEEHAKLLNNYDWHDEVFEENGKKGVKNVKGEILVPAIYDDFLMQETFFFPSLPVAAVKDGKIGLVERDGKGTPRTAFEFAFIERNFFSPVYFVWKPEDKKHFALMAGGTVITPYELDGYCEPCDGCMIVSSGDKYGVLAIDQGLVYVAPEYDAVYDQGFGDDFLFVKNGVEGYVTLDNRFVSKDEYSELEPEEQDELLEVGFVGSVDDI